MFDGKEYEVDCIIFATGFEVGTDYSRRAGYSIIGVNGVSVSRNGRMDCRRITGCTRGVPQLFLFGPAQSAFTATYTFHSMKIVCI